MQTIFISYSKKDKDFAWKLANDLAATGRDVWIDREIGGGAQWRRAIQQALRDAGEVIVIISPNAVKSEWVLHEGSVASGLEKPLFPVLYQPVDKLPIWMEEIQYTDFTNKDYDTAFKQLVDALTPPNPLQDLLDQQVSAYRQTGELIGEALLRKGLFRSALPIRQIKSSFHAAADGQFGGIMKVYREWRISGDTFWMKKLWPQVKQSLDYCISTWDPRGRGILEEPHHNTYDIEYWGPEGHCGSFYLGALTAAIEMGKTLNEDTSRYQQLLADGRKFMETQLYDGEYFYQKIQTEGLTNTYQPLSYAGNGKGYQPMIEALNQQGPKYQYGKGCLSDGVLGFWMARVCGLDGDIVDPAKVRSNLNAIHKYNFKPTLFDHVNPQRPTYAMGHEGGLLLCTWPKGGKLSIPFVYSNEVWTGIEYQAASHLMLEGMVDKGLDIVRACRDRYDGAIRNPFNEYECGHWYGRALSSYGLIQGLTGVRYDAVTQTLYIDSKVGNNFKSFISTATGFGSVGLKDGKPLIDMKMGRLDARHIVISGKEYKP
jgi:hypothetical protein